MARQKIIDSDQNFAAAFNLKSLALQTYLLADQLFRRERDLRKRGGGMQDV